MKTSQAHRLTRILTLWLIAGCIIMYSAILYAKQPQFIDDSVNLENVLTADQNVINVSVSFSYSTSSDRDDVTKKLIKSFIKSAITQAIGSSTLEEVRTDIELVNLNISKGYNVKHAFINNYVRNTCQSNTILQKRQGEKCHISTVDIEIEKIELPQIVETALLDVSIAKEDNHKYILQANKYAATKLSEGVNKATAITESIPEKEKEYEKTINIMQRYLELLPIQKEHAK